MQKSKEDVEDGDVKKMKLEKSCEGSYNKVYGIPQRPPPLSVLLDTGISDSMSSSVLQGLYTS